MKFKSFTKKTISIFLSLVMTLSVMTAGFSVIGANAETAMPSGEKGDGIGISFVNDISDGANDVDKIVLNSNKTMAGTYYLKLTNDYPETARISSITLTNGLRVGTVTTVPAHSSEVVAISGTCTSINTVSEVTVIYTLDDFDNYQEEQYSLTAKGYIYCEYITKSTVEIATNYDAGQAQMYSSHEFGITSDNAWIEVGTLSGGCSVYNASTAHDNVKSSSTGSMSLNIYVNRGALTSYSWQDLGLYQTITNRYSNKVTVERAPTFSIGGAYSETGSLAPGYTNSAETTSSAGSKSGPHYFTGTIPLGSATSSSPTAFTSSTSLQLRGHFTLMYSTMDVDMTFNVYAYDKEELRLYIQSCEGYCLNSALFNTDKWNLYQTALKQAKTVLGQSKVSQYKIEQALSNLEKNFISIQRTCVTDEQAEQLRAYYTSFDEMRNSSDDVYCNRADMLSTYEKYYNTAVDYVKNQYITTYENAEYLLNQLTKYKAVKHTYENRVIAPTCTKGGYTVDVCTKCGYENKETLKNPTASIGHNYSLSSSKSVAPTCTQSGTNVYVCSRCQDSYSETVPAKGHNYKIDKSTVSCVDNGYNVYVCTDCNLELEENVLANGHTWKLTSVGDGTLTYTCANKNCLLQSDGSYKPATFTTENKHKSSIVATVVRTDSSYYASKIDLNNVYDTYYLKLFNPTNTDITVIDVTATQGLAVNFSNVVIPKGGSKLFSIDTSAVITNVNSNITVTYEGGVTSLSIFCAKNLKQDQNALNHKYSYNSANQIALKLNDIFEQTYVESVTSRFSRTASANTCYPVSEWNVYVDKENMLYSSADLEEGEGQGVEKYTWNNTMLALELTSFQSSNYYTIDPIKLTSSTDGSMNFFYAGSELTQNTKILEKVPQSETAWVFFSGKLPTDKATYVNSSNWNITENSSSTTINYTYLAGNFKINAFVYDRSQLRSLVTMCESVGLNSKNYTSASWNKYISALSNATEILGVQKTCQSEVNEAYNTLRSAYNSLALFVHTNDEQLVEIRSFITKYETLRDNPTQFCNAETLINDFAEFYEVAEAYVLEWNSVESVEAEDLIACVSGFVYTAHNYVDEEPVQPTCLTDGYTRHTCSICSDSYTTDVQEKLGHDISEVTIPAQCTVDGRVEERCSRCDYVNVLEVLPQTGHNYVSSVTEPTCTEQGYTTYVCSNCSDTYTDTYIPELGHDLAVRTKQPNCTEEGSKTTYCTRCDYESVVVYKPYGHNYTCSVKSPNCTEQGYARYTCSNCGDTYDENVRPALGHDFITNTVQPTCTKTGLKKTTCTRCEYYKEEVIPQKAHAYNGTVKQPTCTEQGYTTFVCSSCNYSYVGDYKPALGHDLSTVRTEATCTQSGSEVTTCSRCDFYSETAFPAKGHKYVETVVEPTCTEEGYTSNKCSVCGDELRSNPVSALGHDLNTVTKAPTCTEDGYERVECSRCDYSSERALPATGHSLKLIESAPKDNEPGYIYYLCEKCNKTYLYNNGEAGAEVSAQEIVKKSAVSAPSFNTYSGIVGGTLYDYSARGGALKIGDSDADNQKMRFSASLGVPNGATIKDFGFVYTKTSVLNGGVEPNDNSSEYGVDSFVKGSSQIYNCSIFSEGGNYTEHTTEGGTVYTFNLVINVNKMNWGSHYAARSYITYDYNGREYTVYDSSYSSRSVNWIAQMIYDNDYGYIQAYVYDKILSK